MTTRFHSLKEIAAHGLIVLACAGLASCGGGDGSGPVSGGAGSISGDQMAIQPRPSAGTPDLAVGSLSVSDSAPFIGEQFTLSTTVRNDGDGASPATTVRYYRSTDSTITTSDTAVGTDAVAALAASENGNESVELTAPSSASTYYYGACVDAVPDESDATNNCSASVQVDVAERQPQSTGGQNSAETQPQSTGRQNLAERQPQSTGHPDLVAAAPTVSDGGPAAGARFTLSTTVRNDGDGASPATTVRYYRSTDSTITTSDTAVGTDAVAALAASENGNESVELTAPSSASTYYYGACVDAVPDESDATNNCSASVQVDVAERQPQSTGGQNSAETQPQSTGHPDLVAAAPTVSDGGPAAGARFTLSTTVRNDGDGASPATTLRYYRSTDSTITTSDTAVGTDAVAALAASGSAGASVELTAPSNSGTYYYGACVDVVMEESDTTNNCSASVPVTVSDGGEPATEVHLYRLDRVEEGRASSIVVVAWTSGARPPSVSIPVRVSLVEGTATKGVDFAPFAQSVVINPSDFTFKNSRYESSFVILPISILDDTETEGDETFGGTMMLEGDLPFVTLNPKAPDWLSITIVDND